MNPNVCQDCIELIAERDRIKALLDEAVSYLRQGKIQFAPNTTNSRVDVFLSKFEESNTMPKHSNITTRSIEHLVQILRQSEVEEANDALTEAAGDWVNCELDTEQVRTVCADLSREYSPGIDRGTLHKWGDRIDLDADLDQFAASLACELLKAAAYKTARGK